MTQLVRFDTAALNRALVGFDQMFNDFEHSFATQINNNYPPYNVLKYDENSYEIQIAVSGFEPDEISVEVDQSRLIVKGEHVLEPGLPESFNVIMNELKSRGLDIQLVEENPVEAFQTAI